MDEGAQTVANFLKFYNPSLIGGSLGHHIVEVGIFVCQVYRLSHTCTIKFSTHSA